MSFMLTNATTNTIWGVIDVCSCSEFTFDVRGIKSYALVDKTQLFSSLKCSFHLFKIIVILMNTNNKNKNLKWN